MSTARHVSDYKVLLLAVALMASGVVPATPHATAADVPPLASQVQIRRTQFGVPHITGQSLAAAAFGLAYCQAEDHLDNILRGILGVRSQLSETFGPGDQDANITADFFNRQFRVYERTLDNYHKLDPDYRAMVEAFAAGLNYYVERHRDAVPPWTPQVTGHDVAAYGTAGVMRFAFNRSHLLRDFLKSQNAASTTALPETDDEEYGSNMWAFAPSRSQSGHAMLMGNPHQPWAPVSTYYEAHLIVPGRMNFYGSTFIGRPILTSGWNDVLGWSHTVNAPDLEEIYELDLDPARADHFLFDGGSVPLARQDVTIKIRGDKEPALRSRTFWHTPLGPVVSRTANHVYVLRSACYENFRAYEQWLRMTQTRSFEEFRQVLDMNQLPMFNIAYADRAGNIFYIWNGTVPNLPHPAHKAEAVHATRTADIWTTFHATRELPQLLNPPGGYVQNCNSPPYLTNLLAPLDPTTFPPHFSPNDLSLRTQHSLRLINNDTRFSLEDVIRLKHSPLMLLAERVKPDLLSALRAEQPTAELTAAIRVLEEWNNTVASDSRGGTLFASWWERYYQEGVGKFAVPWSASDPMQTPRGLADTQRAVKMFHAALAEVTSLYGGPGATWGEVHRIRKGSVDLPVSGGPGTMGCFRVIEFKRAADNKQVANSGDSFVFAVEFSDPPRAMTNVAYSQSDVPSSPHFSDQAPLFSSNRLKAAAFTEDEIQAQLLKTYRPGEE